jgi:hypothetical protein
MFSKQARDAETHAHAAWNELVEALSSTRDLASGKAKTLGNEAGRRASGAWDVLAGRPAPSRTSPVILAVLAGVAVGWLASEIARRRRTEINQAMTTVGNEVRQVASATKHNIDDRIARAKATDGSPIEKAKAAVGTNGHTTNGMQV